MKQLTLKMIKQKQNGGVQLIGRALVWLAQALASTSPTNTEIRALCLQTSVSRCRQGSAPWFTFSAPGSERGSSALLSERRSTGRKGRWDLASDLLKKCQLKDVTAHLTTLCAGRLGIQRCSCQSRRDNYTEK
jgi:hypothetical protein